MMETTTHCAEKEVIACRGCARLPIALSVVSELMRFTPVRSEDDRRLTSTSGTKDAQERDPMSTWPKLKHSSMRWEFTYPTAISLWDDSVAEPSFRLVPPNRNAGRAIKITPDKLRTTAARQSGGT